MFNSLVDISDGHIYSGEFKMLTFCALNNTLLHQYANFEALQMYFNTGAVVNTSVMFNTDLMVNIGAVVNTSVMFNTDLMVNIGAVVNTSVMFNTDLMVNIGAVVNTSVMFNTDLMVNIGAVVNTSVMFNTDLMVNIGAVVNTSVMFNTDLMVNTGAVVNNVTTGIAFLQWTNPAVSYSPNGPLWSYCLSNHLKIPMSNIKQDYFHLASLQLPRWKLGNVVW